MLTHANNLERTGKISAAPVVELLHEAATNQLSGTFRLANHALKTAVYFDAGKIVFAQTNQRAVRLAVKLVEWNVIKAQDLAGFHDLPDVEIAARLLALDKLSADALHICQSRLIGEIVAAAAALTNGDYWFNPLVRVREDLRAAVDLPGLLVQSARLLPPETIEKRFGDNPLESIAPVLNFSSSFSLTAEEAFALSRVEGVVSAAQLQETIGLPEQTVKKSVYVLWLGNLIKRFNYPQIFDQASIRQFQTARLKLQPTAPKLTAEPAPVKPLGSAAAIEPEARPKINEPEIAAETLEDYLTRVEAARTHYQTLNVAETAEAATVKTAYFRFAKQFHPDKFHQTIGSLQHARLQNAFTRVAAAYETLKDQKARELYDFKLNKEGDAPAAEETAAFKPEVAFEQGMKALAAADFAKAVALLNRAVQLAPMNAEYHARLGQALAVNPKFRHKAEAEFQTALKLDEKNSDLRMLAAEFYMLVGLGKRAANELNRLLVQEPDHQAALEMLAKIK